MGKPQPISTTTYQKYLYEASTEPAQVTAVSADHQPAPQQLMTGLGRGVAEDTAVLQRMTNGRFARAGNALTQLQRRRGNHYVQHVVNTAQNRTGLPDDLKAGVENLSGLSLDDVQVHYNSLKPALLGALAYTQGTEIHIAPGQESYLTHEVWHVAQQKQGRVQPTLQMNGTTINDDSHLEREADVMGKKAIQMKCAGGALVKFSEISHLVAEVDHIVPQTLWGCNSVKNTQIISAYENGPANKGDNYPYGGYTGYSVFDPSANVWHKNKTDAVMAGAKNAHKLP